MVQYQQHVLTVYKNGCEKQQIKDALEWYSADGYVNRDYKKMYEDNDKVMYVLLYVRYSK